MSESISFFPFGTIQANTDEDALQRRIHQRRQTEDAINTLEGRIKSADACKEVARVMGALLKDAETGAISNTFEMKLVEILYSSHRRTIQNGAEAVQSIERRIAQYKEVLEYIDQLKARIAANKAAVAPTVWTLKEIQETLSEMPAITDIQILSTDGILAWTYRGLKMVPDVLPANLIAPEGWGVPLTDVTITVDLCTGVTSFRGKSEVKHYHDTKVCHPHVMYDYTPCWGSFEYMFIDCLENANLLGIATIAQLFLQQINTADTAGKGWPRWLKGLPDTVSSEVIEVKNEQFRITQMLTTQDRNPAQVIPTDKWVCVASSYGSSGAIPANVREILQTDHNVAVFADAGYTIRGRNE